MSSKRKAGEALKRVQQKAAAASESKPNPFEKIRAKVKHEVIGRKIKGAEKDMGQARAKAVRARQQSLLVEFQSMDKSSAFVDRRFGEANGAGFGPAMTEEDKILKRFQRERQKMWKKGGMYNLSDSAGDGDTLTHGGVPLSDVQHISAEDAELTEGLGAEEQDDEEDLNAEKPAAERVSLLDRLKAWEEQRKESGQKDNRTKKEIFQELIMKSKLYKAERTKQKQELDQQLTTLDSSFSELRALMEFKDASGDKSKSGSDIDDLLRRLDKASKGDPDAEADALLEQMLAHSRRESGEDKTGAKAVSKKEDSKKSTKAASSDGEEEEEKTKKDEKEKADDDVDEFTMMARELGMESRARAAEKLKTPEELARIEREKLEALERARLARMRGEEVSEEDAAKGSRKRKRKAMYENEEPKKKEKSKSKAAPTDDDLVDNTEMSWKTFGAIVDDDEQEDEITKAKPKEDDEEAEEQEEAAGSDAELSGAESDGDGEDAETKTGDEDGEEQDDDETKSGDEDGSEEEEDEDEDFADVLEEEEVPKTKAVKKQGTAARSAAETTDEVKTAKQPSMDDISFTPSIPSSLKEIKKLISGRPSDQVSTLFSRIRSYNHPSLSEDNKRNMETFYDIMLDLFEDTCRHIGTECSASPRPASVARLDQLTTIVFEYTELMPKAAAAVWRRRLNTIRRAVYSRLAQHESGWLSGSQLLLMKLLASLFPTSDFRHNVCTPAFLFLSECLSRIPIEDTTDVSYALFICSLLLHFVQQSQRLVPEVVAFLSELLVRGFELPTQPAGGKTAPTRVSDSELSALPITFASSPADWLWKSLLTKPSAAPSESEKKGSKSKKSAKAAAAEPSASSASAEGPKANIWQLLLLPRDHASRSSDAFRQALLRLSLQLLAGCPPLYGTLPSFPELFGPALAALNALKAASKHWPADIQSLFSAAISSIESRSLRILRERRPLIQEFIAKPLKQYTPVYVENFAPERDLDPDKRRAELRKLKKKVKQERKGAIRELRRDTEFIAHERLKIETKQREEKEKKRKEVWTSLLEQQRDTNQTRAKAKKKTLDTSKKRQSKRQRK